MEDSDNRKEKQKISNNDKGEKLSQEERERRMAIFHYNEGNKFYKEKKYTIKDSDNPYGTIIKKKITDIQNNLCEDKYGWRYQVI